MSPLRCLIIEDEFTAVELLKIYIEQMPDVLTFAHSCDNANEALRLLQKGDIDLIFLDMEISGRMNGLDFLQFTENDPNRPPVIVTTGKKEYLPDSFEFNVKAYLFKPFSFETFKKKVLEVVTLPKILVENINKEDVTEQQALPSRLILDFVPPQYFFIKTTIKGQSVTQKLDFNQLKYVEARDKQAHYYVEDGTCLSVWDSLDSIVNKILPKGVCCRAHDKWLIGSKHFVKKIYWSDDRLIMTDGREIPIGQTYKNGLKKFLENV
jgi:two-component system, LytTR family, response regulator